MSHLLVGIALVSAFFISLSGASQNPDRPRSDASSEIQVVHQDKHGRTEGHVSESPLPGIVTSSLENESESDEPSHSLEGTEGKSRL